MALTNEDLFAISQLLDAKLDSKLKSELQPLKDDIRDIKLHLENVTDKNITRSSHFITLNFTFNNHISNSNIELNSMVMSDTI